MAAVAVHSAMSHEGNTKQTHPFFLKTKSESDRSQAIKQPLICQDHELEQLEPPSSQNDEIVPVIEDNLIAEPSNVSKAKTTKEKRKDMGAQKTIFQGFGIKQEMKVDSNEADLQSDPNHERRKRQKTVSAEPTQPIANGQHRPAVNLDLEEGEKILDRYEQLQIDAKTEPAEKSTDTLQDLSSNHAIESAAEPVRTATDNNFDLETKQNLERGDRGICVPSTPTKSEIADQKSSRVMRLKGGKLASPKAELQEKGSPRGRRGKKSKANEGREFMVKIQYPAAKSGGESLGVRIQRILDGEETFPSKPASEPALKPTFPKKTTHPFFTGKVTRPSRDQPETVTEHASPKKNDRLQIVSPRKAAAFPNRFQIQKSGAGPTPSELTAFGSVRKAKQIGGLHPPWPSCDNTHVRGLDDNVPVSIELQDANIATKSTKRKYPGSPLDVSDNILLGYVKSFESSDEASVLRVPKRLVAAGADLQAHVSQSLSSPLGPLPGKMPTKQFELGSMHPALKSMFSMIDKELSPFDNFECATLAWTHKYAPKSTAEVLQAGKEAFVLRDMLQRSTISAVQTSSNRSTTSSTVSFNVTKTKAAKKKRKRKDDLDNFIASSDDDDDEYTLEPLDDNSRSTSDQPTLTLGGNDFMNAPVLPGRALLLSGPHGCGKSATVYAVAKELGFEVFELNSASRRSGKDVLEKVGDMTGNHQVQQQMSKALAEDKAPSGVKLEAIKVDEPEVPDAKQKSMAAFFKPAVLKAALATAPKVPPLGKTTTAKEAVKTKAVQQKQSLILLEEVDILFEEDKQFWLTILTMVLYSKRPIIMTCNDERFVPESLTFHAILRFVPPPVDLATDYLLLLAAREGHLLTRSSVESLYTIKGYDLRASITELNFWCQMAVGDPTGGFNWMIERYPPGIDVDAYGRTLRVISQNTYLRDMGIFSRDLDALSKCPDQNAHDELWTQVWDDWNLELSSLCSEKSTFQSLDCRTKLQHLEQWDLACDMASVGDVYFGLSMRQPNKQRLDHSLPPLAEKTKTSYTLSLSGSQNVLQADPIPEYTTLDKHLGVHSLLRVSHLLLQGNPDHAASFGKQTTGEQIVGAVERSHVPHNPNHQIRRADFAIAFDPLAYDPDDASTYNASAIAASSFDREFSVITTDLAPYIRTIAHEYKTREQEQIRLSTILSAGGQAKRRQTRAARTAVEGGRRQDQRCARYFDKLSKMDINWTAVMATAGEGWIDRREVAESSVVDGTTRSAMSSDEVIESEE